MATATTKYSCVADLKTGTFLANSRELVRVMGVVTAIGDCSSADKELLSPIIAKKRTRPTLMELPSRFGNSQQDAPFFVSVTIDDGTDSFAVCAPKSNLQSPSNVIVGKTYDCLLKLKQNGERKVWLAETFVAIENPMDEHLRWLELGHHGQSLSRSSSARLRYSNLCHQFGFPSRKRNRLEAYRLICVNFKLQQPPEEPIHKKKQSLSVRPRSLPVKRRRSGLIARTPLASQPLRPRGLQPTSSAHKNRIAARRESLKRISPPSQFKTPQPKTQAQAKSQTKPSLVPLEGLLLKDLATVLQKSEREVQEMIEDLQMEGKIYQNERGEYLPL